MPPGRGRVIGHGAGSAARGGGGASRGRGGGGSRRNNKFEEEDIDDDLAFDSEDEQEFGWFFDTKTDGTPKTKGKPGSGQPSRGAEKQSVKEEFKKLRSMDDNDDDDDDSDDHDSDDSREEIDLSDMLDSKEERAAKKASRRGEPSPAASAAKAEARAKAGRSAPQPNQRTIRGAETLAPSQMAASVATAAKGSKAKPAFTVAATSLTDLLSAAASGAPLPEDGAVSAADGDHDEGAAAAIPSAVADRLNTMLAKKALKIRKEKDPYVKELEDRAQTRRVVKEDMKTWKPMLEDMKRAKTVQFPLKMPNSTAVPSTLGGLASAFETSTKENQDAAAEAAALAIAGTATGPTKKKKSASLSDPTSVAPDGFSTPGARLAATLANAMREKLADSGLIEATAAAPRRTPSTRGTVETPFGHQEGQDGTYVALDNGQEGGTAGATDGPVGYVRKLKALLSYEIAKRRRFNKIKSKAYRRILRKEKERGEEKRQQAEDLLDPDRAQRRLAAKMDRARAEERVTQKHKNTSKWVKHVKRMAKFDAGTREAIQDQDVKRQELMKRMEEPAEHELEEADDDVSSSEDEDRLVDQLFSDKAGGEAAGGLDSLWGTGAAEGAHPSETHHPDGTPLTAVEKSRKELFNMKFMKKERDRQQRQMTAEFDQMKEDIASYNNGTGVVGAPGDVPVGSSDDDNDEDTPAGRRQKAKKKQQRGATAKRRRGANRPGGSSSDEDADAREEREALAKDDKRAVMERISGSSRLWERERERDEKAANAAAALRQQRLQQQQMAATAARNTQGFAEAGRRTFGTGGFSSAFATGLATQPGMLNDAVQRALPQISLPAFGGIKIAKAAVTATATAPDHTVVKASEADRFVEEGDDGVVGGEEQALPPSRSTAGRASKPLPTSATSTSVSAASPAKAPTAATAGVGATRQRAPAGVHFSEDATVLATPSADMSTELLVTRAFAQDDIDAEFLQMKGAQVEGIMKPKDTNASLPGWGSWGGTDDRLNLAHKAKVQHIEHERGLEKSLLMKARADAHLDHVIINHDVDLVPSHHTLHMVPRPFTNAKDYQRASRQTFGPESNTAGSFIEGVAPKIKTARGIIIDPLDKEMSLRKAPKTQRRSGVAEALKSGPSAVKQPSSPAPATAAAASSSASPAAATTGRRQRSSR